MVLDSTGKCGIGVHSIDGRIKLNCMVMGLYSDVARDTKFYLFII